MASTMNHCILLQERPIRQTVTREALTLLLDTYHNEAEAFILSEVRGRGMCVRRPGCWPGSSSSGLMIQGGGGVGEGGVIIIAVLWVEELVVVVEDEEEDEEEEEV
ncbi:hypothetical protein CRUP_000568 [Coryphaenoides rupestris]|nr:hypothetical protein CRUP_000568 [Coryphaenoides rupestris]